MLGNERGYSLIELMLALTVIGLLAAVAAPKVSHVMAVSRTQKVAADLQMLDAAAVMYEAEHGAPPAAGDIRVLADYVENIDSVKPPKGGAVIVNGQETDVKADAYQLTEKSKGNPRATCDGETAEAFLPSRASHGVSGASGASSGGK